MKERKKLLVVCLSAAALFFGLTAAPAEKVKADAAKAQSAPSLQKKPQNAHPAGGKNPHPNGNRPQNRQNPRRNPNQS